MTCTLDSGPAEIPRNETNSNLSPISSSPSFYPVTSLGTPLPVTLPTPFPSSLPVTPPVQFPSTLSVSAPVEVQDPPRVDDSIPSKSNMDSSLPTLDQRADANASANTSAIADADMDAGDLHWLSISRLSGVRTDLTVLILGIIFIAVAIFIFVGVYRTLLARTIYVRGQYAVIK
jgi:hypothetical protein